MSENLSTVSVPTVSPDIALREQWIREHAAERMHRIRPARRAIAQNERFRTRIRQGRAFRALQTRLSAQGGK